MWLHVCANSSDFFQPNFSNYPSPTMDTINQSRDEARDLIYQFGKRAVEQFQTEDASALTGVRTNNYLSMFAAYYSTIMEEFGKLEIIEAQMWPTFRGTAKSDAGASREWASTEHGLRQIELKYLIKSLEKLMSACKGRLEQLKVESYNHQ